MTPNKKILSELSEIRALAATMDEKAARLEALLTGGGTPVSTRRGEIEKEVMNMIVKRNRKLFK